ncbi:MAG: tetratricopeptide repeat protein, partial [Acidobacteriaceae bacterium]|nr:tetratricopeptide repeat protein [Acidobacteriaceae bacterium]
GDRVTLKNAAEHAVTDLLKKLSPRTDIHAASLTDVGKVHHRDSPEAAARELGANLILTGTVKGTAEQMHMNVALHNLATGKVEVWDKDFSDVTRNLVNVEDEIYSHILAELKLHPSGEDRTTSREEDLGAGSAFDLCRLGREAMRNVQDLKNVERAINFFEMAKKKDPSYAQAWGGLADAYLQMYLEKRDLGWLEKTKGAAAMLRDLNRDAKEGRQADIHIVLGRIYDATGESEKAIAELKLASKLTPNSDEVYRRLGLAYEHLGKKEEALRSYQSAVIIEPRYWVNHDTLGKAYFRFGDFKAAEHEFTVVRGSVDNSSNPVALEGLGNVYFYEGKYNECISYYEEALKVQPYFGTVSNLGFAYFALKRYPDAVRTFETAVKLNPEHEAITGNLADAYWWLGNKEKATETYRKAIGLARNDLQANPRDATAMGHLARYYAKIGEPEQALRFIKRATAASPKDPELRYDEAIVEIIAGQVNPAARALKRAVENGYPIEDARTDPELTDLLALPGTQKLIAQATHH